MVPVMSFISTFLLYHAVKPCSLEGDDRICFVPVVAATAFKRPFLVGSANQCILGDVYLRFNLSKIFICSALILHDTTSKNGTIPQIMAQAGQAQIQRFNLCTPVILALCVRTSAVLKPGLLSAMLGFRGCLAADSWALLAPRI